MELKKSIRNIIKYVAGSVLFFNVLSLIWVLIYGVIPIPTTKLMVLEKQETDLQYNWKDLNEISDKIQLAVMCAEDQRFLLHTGLDFGSIDDGWKPTLKVNESTEAVRFRSRWPKTFSYGLIVTGLGRVLNCITPY